MLLAACSRSTQMLEVDELDTVNTTPKHEGNKVVGGIEYNPWNRPVGYFFRQYSIDGMENVEPVDPEAKECNLLFYQKETFADQRIIRCGTYDHTDPRCQ